MITNSLFSQTLAPDNIIPFSVFVNLSINRIHSLNECIDRYNILLYSLYAYYELFTMVICLSYFSLGILNYQTKTT